MLIVKRRRLKRKVPFIICCLLLIALLAGGYEMFKNDFNLPEIDSFTDPDQVKPGQRLNVLLLGIDARSGETMARTDTLILASVDTKSKQMSLLSIPRDTRVNIPKHGWDKINSASVYGGTEMSMKVVSDLLGTPIKYYVQANFNGFKDIVDALGGVTLDVEQDMYHYDPDDGGAYTINLEKGVQPLDGDKALQYVRYREYAMGDIDRTTHQQKFLVALAKEMLQPSTILKLPALVPEVNKYVKTNLSVSDMMTLASAGKKLENGNIVAQTLPGRPIDINGGSYWGVDPDEAKQMVANLFNGETVTNVVLTSPLSGLPVSTESSSKGKDAQPEDEEPEDEEPEDEETSSSTQQPSSTTQNQSEDKQTPAKTGQGTKSGATSPSGSKGTVTITPVDDDSEKGTTSDRTGSSGDTQTGTGTGKTGQSDASQDDTSQDGTNQGIPGIIKPSSPGQT
ncbi:MAG: LCP family protein [Desulfotomaculaceae bacterium]|nr:LCP family protein [Desulfotomaculaceae bacterium]